MVNGARDEVATRSSQAPGPAKGEGPPGPVWLCGWACILALAGWLAQLSLVLLVLAGMAAAVWATWSVRHGGRWARGTAAALILSLAAAALAQYRLHRVANRWPEVQREVENRAATALNQGLDDLVVRGEAAAEEAARVVGDTRRTPRSARLFQRMEVVRRTGDFSAVAVFDSSGSPVAWAGSHPGQIPLAVRRGSLSYVFHQGPLFSYLYLVRPLPEGGAAVAAALLESTLGSGDLEGSFATWFASRHGLTPRFTLPDRARCETIWDWSVDQPILSACFLALTDQAWWARIQRRGRWQVALSWAAALALLSIGWYRRRLPTRPGVPILVATAGVLLLPLGWMLDSPALFSSQFVLPLPVRWDVGLGMFLVLLTGGTLWLLTRSESGATPRLRLPWWVQAALIAGYLPLALALIRTSASGGLLAGHPGGGFFIQLATTLLIGAPAYVLLARGRAGGSSARAPALIAAAAVLHVTIAIAGVLLWRPDRPFTVWHAALWGAPFALAAVGLPRLRTRFATLARWLFAGFFAGTVALTALWLRHLEAKLEYAELELARLGTETDPYLDFLLRVFADKARMLDAEGESGVNLLYRGWVASGLAEAGYEARLNLWRHGVPYEELRLTEHAELPPVVEQSVEQSAELGEAVFQRFTQVPGLHYLALVPLSDDRILSVAIPPRSRLRGATALARFLQASDRPDGRSAVDALYLVPSTDPVGDSIATARSGTSRDVEWAPTESGWRSEARAHFPPPAGWMHAHLFVTTSELSLLLVRAALSLVALLAVLGAMWLLARSMTGGLGELPVPRREWIQSFRGRLTLALFVFFLVPTGVFGVVAYQAVSREVVRSAEGLASRALEQSVATLARAPLPTVAAEVGVDLLVYDDGVLTGAAAPEVIQLGLFDAWLPPSVFLTFAAGEDLQEIDRRRLGENDYLVGYRRIDPFQVLAAPIPLASEEIARRQVQFRDIALLMSLLGAAFSVVLSLLVGRALTRPLDELSRAAGTVGSGNLRIRLPERRADEFGAVYRSFNHMVARLRGARTALLQETRRTETIVAEAATGVLALDAYGNVELVNPRATEILGTPLDIGGPLPQRDGVLGAVADAFRRFWSSREAEAGAELEVEGRVVRLRMRRLSPRGGHAGAVVALEDVTAEVRTARVLAWGEMARQVAHEIKNPLTPIKLSVQHLRRAFFDRRPDYGEILESNVASILQEIDRLGDIARAFARFGTPDSTVGELEEVRVARVVEETLALYRGTGEGIRYEVRLDDSAPELAVARLGELKEVLINLLENAREAVGGDGEITVSVTPAPDSGSGSVEVVVADTGEGIEPELLPRIFEPRFSTRTSGTGLGLAIVRRMVESWGGEVSAESQPGVGTQMRLRLRALNPAGGDVDE